MAAGPPLKLLVLGGAARGKAFPLEGAQVEIGKDPRNDLVLPDDTVSRRHCRIARTDGGWLLSDLGSRNGTVVNGVPVKEAVLAAGATLDLGGVPLRVVAADAPSELLAWDEDRFEGMRGRSLAMRQLFATLARVADAPAPVLLEGETGPGKELAARARHARSRRAPPPVVAVGCGAIAAALIESELFGHERGAFTGADAARKGAFEAAAGGTLLLDEISELPLDLQPKLLRALEAREVRRLGAGEPVKVDVRVLVATRKRLQTEVERGKFRKDLYFRIAPIELRLPSLRERREDVPVLVRHFLARVLGEEPAAQVELAEGELSALAAHDWPGNVRELRNVVERAASLSFGSGGRQRAPLRLPLVLDEARRAPPPPPDDGPEGVPFAERKAAWEAAFEKAYLPWLLSRAEGNVSEAARLARMDRKHLADLLRKHGLR